MHTVCACTFISVLVYIISSEIFKIAIGHAYHLFDIMNKGVAVLALHVYKYVFCIMFPAPGKRAVCPERGSVVHRHKLLCPAAPYGKGIDRVSGPLKIISFKHDLSYGACL